jgi:predicted Fe-Mo cluster-binding NifX family protein
MKKLALIISSIAMLASCTPQSEPAPAKYTKTFEVFTFENHDIKVLSAYSNQQEAEAFIDSMEVIKPEGYGIILTTKLGYNTNKYFLTYSY